jgi:hypothetical protein
VTAEATRARPLNVLVMSWIDWLYTAGGFKEYVLSADYCATRPPLPFVQPCGPRRGLQPDAAGSRRFIA